MVGLASCQSAFSITLCSSCCVVISDIAAFLLKRDVKLQPTNLVLCRATYVALIDVLVVSYVPELKCSAISPEIIATLTFPVT